MELMELYDSGTTGGAANLHKLLDEMDRGIRENNPSPDRDFLPVAGTNVRIEGGTLIAVDDATVRAAREKTRAKLLALFAESLRKTDKSRHWPELTQKKVSEETEEEPEKPGLHVFVQVDGGKPREIEFNKKMTPEELAGCELKPGQNMLIFVRAKGGDVPLKIGEPVRFAKSNGQWRQAPPGSTTRMVIDNTTCSVPSEELSIPDTDADILSPESAQFAEFTEELNALASRFLSVEDLDFDRLIADPEVGALVVLQRALRFFRDHANAQSLIDQMALIGSGVRDIIFMPSPNSHCFSVAYVCVEVDAERKGLTVTLNECRAEFGEIAKMITDKPLDQFVFDDEEEGQEPGYFSKGEILKRRIDEMDRIYYALWNRKLSRQIEASPRFNSGNAEFIYARFKQAAKRCGLEKSSLKAYLGLLFLSKMASLQCFDLSAFAHALDACATEDEICAVVMQFSGRKEQFSDMLGAVQKFGQAIGPWERNAQIESIIVSAHNGACFDEMLRRVAPPQARWFRGALLPAYLNAAQKCKLTQSKTDQLANVFLSRLVEKVKIVDAQMAKNLSSFKKELDEANTEEELVKAVNSICLIIS